MMQRERDHQKQELSEPHSEPSPLERAASAVTLEQQELWQKKLQIYDSKARSLQFFRPQSPPLVTFYSCGPTVYDVPHIGNLRTFLFEDLLARLLVLVGYECRQVMNITDVDDKTIAKALKQGTSLKSYTEEMTKLFFEDLKALRVTRAYAYPRATDYIPEMERMIEKLLDRGHAYEGEDGSVYFSIASSPQYGELSGRRLCQESHGVSHVAAQEVCQAKAHALDEYEDAADFVLWKAYQEERDGPFYWDSKRLGRGRPGWHIECSAMAHALLGETIDLHTGGVDNLFPHHENEIAQSRGCFGQELSRHWMHAAHLLVEGKKMSKSLGNFTTWRDLQEQGYSASCVRYTLLQTHYRHALNFTKEGLKAASSSIKRIEALRLRLKGAKLLAPKKNSSDSLTLKQLQALEEKMIDAILEDLNVSSALAAFFDFLRLLNSYLDLHKGHFQVDHGALQEGARRFILLFDALFDLEEKSHVDPELLELASLRAKARKERNFALADELREVIAAKGWSIEDGRDGEPIFKRR